MFLEYFLLMALFKSAKTTHNTASDLADLKTIFLNDLEINLSHGNTPDVKHFIDGKIEDFVDTLKKSHRSNNRHGITRRSLSSGDLGKLTKDNSGVYILDGYDTVGNVPVVFPKDIKLFDFNGRWYATALECGQEKKQPDRLVVFKNVHGKFVEVVRTSVRNGVKIDTYTAKDTSLIVVSENTTEKDLLKKPSVYEFTKEEALVKIQNLDVNYATDVVIWSMERDIYMAIAQRMHVHIYKWLGRHFDLIQKIATKGGHKILPFAIKSGNFLATTNNDRVSEDPFVEIFKFDLDGELFVPHQKLSTKYASDVKFLCFKQAHEKDSFLLIANEYEIGENGDKTYDTISTIYKYVDDYFIPFQTFALSGAIQWLPVVGTKGELVVLLSSKFEGAKSFQYDGWRFVETDTQYTDGAFGRGILSMDYHMHDHKPHIVVANEFDDGTFVNIFAPIFKHQNPLGEFQEEMLKWCNEAMGEVEKVHLRKSRSAPQKPTRFDTDTELEELQMIQLELDEQIHLFNNIKTNFEHLNTLEGDIIANEVIAEEITFGSLSANTINALDVASILANSINITENITVTKPLVFDVIKTNVLLVGNINGHPRENLLHKNHQFNLTHLEVDGNVIMENTVTIGDALNGVKIADDSVLINGKNQTLKGDLIFESVQIEMVTAGKIAEIFVGDQSPVGYIKNWSVKNVDLKGRLNNIDLATLEELALKKSGIQTISEEYSFDEVTVGDITIDGHLSEVDVSNFIRTDYGDYDIHQDVYFSDVTVGEMSVSATLNQINIDNGKIDVLLRNAPHVQYISGPKHFRNLQLMNPFGMRFKIECKALEKMNPVVTIDDELVIKSDVILQGNVTVEKMLVMADAYTKNLQYSLADVAKRGVKITDLEIPVHFNFTQQLNVGGITVDQINGVGVRSWVVNGLGETQVISGSKVFLGDVYISGQTELVKVNHINVPEMVINTLTTNGEQIITGKHHFSEVVAPRVVGNVNLGEQSWKNVIVLDEEQIITGVTVVNSIKTTNTKTFALTATNGLINGVDFTEMVSDTVRTPTLTNKIGGLKQFAHLNVDNLIAQNGSHVVKPTDVKRVVFGRPIKLPDHIEIENIHFTDYCNGLSSTNFGFDWVESYGHQVMDGEQIFSNMVVYGTVYTKSDSINGVALSELYQNTVKIDEEHYFNSVTFDDTPNSDKGITVGGHIIGLDLDNIVTPGDNAQTIPDQIVFTENITIEGRLHLNGLVSQLNLTQLCMFAGSDHLHHLIVDGDARFGFGPQLKYVNEYSIEEILRDAWFTNEATTIEGNIQMGDAIFDNNVAIDGLIDGVNLAHFSEVYFSKSRNQHVTANLYFTDDVTFADDISSPSAILKGDINDFNLEEFKNTAILDGVEQVFENTPLLEHCEILDFDGDFTVNGLNLETDVMRYDSDNIVTGMKTVKNLDVTNLFVKNTTKVQDVVLNEWLKRVVLNNGSFSITGRKVFGNITLLEGIGSEYVNGMEFNKNTILLKSLEQNITGRKTIKKSSFERVELQGTLNGYELDDVFNGHAKKNADLIFQSPLNFMGGLTATNTHFEETYSGINITGLIHNVSQLTALNNYNRNYETLLNISHKITDSLKSQAYFLHDYKIAQTFKGFAKVVPISYRNMQYLVGISEGGYNNLYFWNEYKKTFENTPDNVFDFEHPTYINTVDFNRQQILYVETTTTTNSPFTHYGQFLSVANDNTLKSVLSPILTNGTKHLVSFIEPTTNETCFVFVDSENSGVSIYCPYQTGLVVDDLKVIAPTIVNVIHVKNIPFLIIITKNTSEANISIWKYNLVEKHFAITQIMYVTEPISITTAFYKNTHYLAIASGHVSNIIHQGLIDVRRFDETTEMFTSWQILTPNVPIQVEFSILPSDEFVLYVLKEDESEPLLVYVYEGIAGFNLKMSATAMPKQKAIRAFGTYNRHFLVSKNYDGIDIIEAVFKGDRYL